MDTAFKASKSVIVDKPLAEPTCVAFDHTGTLLAIACEREVEVRIVHTSEILATLEGHLARVRAVNGGYSFEPLQIVAWHSLWLRNRLPSASFTRFVSTSSSRAQKIGLLR